MPKKPTPKSPGRRRLKRAIAQRRDFHMNPEMGLEEKRTQKVIRDRLKGLGIRHRAVAGTGVLGIIPGAEKGRTLMLRADMDALPVTEENEVAYASKSEGVMHACGHDGHMAILLEAAAELREAGVPRGSVKLCFQPGEEGFRGAQKVIDDGGLEDPKVDACFGLHLWRDVPVGKVAILDGPCMAATDLFEITVTGKGGHAAMPHLSVDPVVVAAHVVTALQTIVSRQVDPLDTAVVTVGSIESGTAFNVIPEKAVLRGTCRTFKAATRKRVQRRVREIAKGVARSLGGRAAVDYVEFLPATVNDKKMAALAREAAAAVVGRRNVVESAPSMGGEDMSLFQERVPGCFAFVGLRNQKRGIEHPHHHPRFDMDEECLAVGVDLMVEVARRFLAG
ncbi:MAG: M20 metallopeptidase family protein [Planctomycetota bacterium]|jgi:amidohydrolase